jgi:hypothetical protein
MHFSFLIPVTTPSDALTALLFLFYIIISKLNLRKYRAGRSLAQGDTNSDWHSHGLTVEWIFLSCVIGCSTADVCKVLVSSMTLTACMAMPDKAMRHNQNLI